MVPVEMRTPASPAATAPRDDHEFNNDHDPTKRNAVVADTKTADAIETSKSKPRSSLTSDLANMSLPLPENGELRSRFLSMCTTLLNSYDMRDELIKKNERLQNANDGLTETLANRTGIHKQQMQRVQDESDRVGIDLTKAQVRNIELQEELAETKERAKQLEIQFQQDLKEHNTQHEQDVEEYSRLEQDKIQLEMDLIDAKQRGEFNKNRYELELRKQGEQAKDLKKKDGEINEKSNTIEALRKIVAAKDQARLEKQQESDELRHTLKRTDDSLKKSLAHHRFVLPIAMNAQSDLAYAHHSLSLAYDESDEYAFANIGALVHTATARGQGLREQMEATKRMLEAKDREVAQLKVDTLCLNNSLGDANKLAETEKLARTTANAELDQLRGELKDFRSKHETAEAEVNTWKGRYRTFERHLAKTNSDKDALSKEKERLLDHNSELDKKLAASTKLRGEVDELKKKHATAEASVNFWKNACQEGVRLAISNSETEKEAVSKERERLFNRISELERQIASAKRKPETRAAGVQCELETGIAVHDEKQCGSQCQAKLPSHACMDHLEPTLANASLATQVRELYREDVKRHLEIRIDGKVLPHPRIKPQYARSDKVKSPLDDLLLLAQILDIYKADTRGQVEVRVTGVTILRGFNVPQICFRGGKRQPLLDRPLVEAKTVPEEIILSDKPWIPSSIEFASEDLTEPGRYDLSKLPEVEGQHNDERDQGDGALTIGTLSDMDPVAARHMSISSAPPAPDFMQGANIICTRQSIDCDSPHVINEELSKAPSILKGADIRRLEIPKQRDPQPQSVARATSLEPPMQQSRPQPQSVAIPARLEIPKQQHPQSQGVAGPTPVSSVQTSPRDSVLITPRSPMEGDINRKRPASQERNTDTKRHAPSDPVRDAPKQPRNYDARREYQQDRAYRVSPTNVRKRSHGDRTYDSYRPESDATRPPLHPETDEDREKERQRTAACYGRRWDR